jgi:hypothetical protein
VRLLRADRALSDLCWLDARTKVDLASGKLNPRSAACSVILNPHKLQQINER